MKHVFLARYDTSEDGRGHEKVVGAFPTAALATAAVRSAGAWAMPPAAIPYYETLQEYEDGAKELLRQSALLKLTAQEKEALGLV